MNKLLAVLIVAPLLLASGECQGPVPEAQQTERAAVASNQKRLIQDIPPPVLETSLERKNLVERLKRINAPTMTGCVYLISYGQVVAFYPVKGKVTSLNAYLMGAETVEYHGDTSGGNIALEQPDFDGAYGKNADGVFFFTAETNSYVEWAGDYLFTDQCLTVNIQPQLTRQVK